MQDEAGRSSAVGWNWLCLGFCLLCFVCVTEKRVKSGILSTVPLQIKEKAKIKVSSRQNPLN